MIPPKLG